MKYESRISPQARDWEDGLDEDLLTDDFEEIDRKVAHFTAQIAELEAELKRLNKQSYGRREEIEYEMDVLDEQRSILRGYKEALEGKVVSNEVIFAELERKLKTTSPA
jgi:predicted  nucleic acid-binding Zn-ribbon protein